MSAPEFDILDGDQMALAVFAHFMETGRPATIRDIALATDQRQAQVISKLDTLRKDRWKIRGCVKLTVEREGKTAALAWEPSPTTLRAVILAHLGHVGALDREAHPERYLTGRDYAESNCP